MVLIEKVFGFPVAIGKFCKEALVALPVKVEGDKAEKQRDT